MADDDFLEVHVDETGDRGFGPRASPVFCLAACVFRRSKVHNALAPAVWGKRDLESYAVKSMVEGWHQSQTWWPAFTARVPVQ
ncbi:hypothetical protein [Candidatus Poriferisodalis sp.]|uniref:hypothetical protein n=1 Tax=Candidatus Poriferisodalis sp. TaxID=3101277 RepID=UPI003B01BF42